MPLLESDRLANELKKREEEKGYLAKAVDEGRDAERLVQNPSWVKFYRKIMDVVEKREIDKIKIYDSIVGAAITQDEIAKAFLEIREINLEVVNLKYVINLPQMAVEAGERAREGLKKITEAENGRSTQSGPEQPSA